jgi:hypothetical protein
MNTNGGVVLPDVFYAICGGNFDTHEKMTVHIGSWFLVDISLTIYV